MSKQEEKSLVPERRFPEFQGKAAWELKELGDCLDYLQPTNYLVSSTAYDDKYEVPVLTAGKTFILGYTNETEGVFDKKLPVIIFDDFTTASKYVDFPFKAKSSAMKILLAKKHSNIKFVYESMQMIKYEVGVHERHWISTFSKIKIPVPCNKEQQRIADFLTSIDEQITARSQKIDSLRAHKKGLMQQLFPAEGESEPKRRFPEFREKGEWKLQTLDGLAKRGSGHTPNKKVSNYYNGGIKWVSLADSSKLDKRYIHNTKIEISKEGIKNSSAVLHAAGSVILSRDAGVGKSAVLHSEMAVSQHFIVWTCDECKLSNWFLYYVLQILKPTFESIAVGNTIKTIGLPYFKKLCIFIPSIKEQQKIANCLTSIDELIVAQSQILDSLKAHKKGLMHQIFPATNKVSA
ncbi:restriction endonuclease subunit S [Pseudomonas viridiflava]|uniref:restriction endonuclease subunit S n=1 Tax=Pseudomonas viridiflava TaxID=33069 RepID=UPI001BD07586|nr:restriction endonuclease subunit S [Pseudomonas viridiflava]QVI85620.1 restriction endonuclease subunit S [Pseudomonas viridiflava]